MNNELGKERGHSRHLANGQFTGSALPSLRGRRRSEVSQGEVTNISDGGFCMVATHPLQISALLPRPTSARSDSRGNPHSSPSSLGTASGVRASLPNRPAVCHLNSSRYCFLSYIPHLAGANLSGYFDQRIDAAFLH